MFVWAVEKENTGNISASICNCHTAAREYICILKIKNLKMLKKKYKWATNNKINDLSHDLHLHSSHVDEEREYWNVDRSYIWYNIVYLVFPRQTELWTVSLAEWVFSFGLTWSLVNVVLSTSLQQSLPPQHSHARLCHSHIHRQNNYNSFYYIEKYFL